MYCQQQVLHAGMRPRLILRSQVQHHWSESVLFLTADTRQKHKNDMTPAVWSLDRSRRHNSHPCSQSSTLSLGHSSCWWRSLQTLSQCCFCLGVRKLHTHTYQWSLKCVQVMQCNLEYLPKLLLAPPSCTLLCSPQSVFKQRQLES